MKGNIVWLASYPKSGNTWFRAFITNLMGSDDEPSGINSLTGELASSRIFFDAMSGTDSSNLFPDEVDELLPAFFNKFSRDSKDVCYLKTHDAYRYLPDTRPVFPPEATRCAIYMVRNPLDVAPSFAYFMDIDLDNAIARLNNDEYVLNAERNDITSQLSQKLLSWSGHVMSWLNVPSGMMVHLLRYEDMIRHPAKTFEKAVKTIGLEKSKGEIERALEFSSFEKLRELERQEGFREKPPWAQSFFRQGKAGAWRATLTEKQIGVIITKHGEIMRRLGYLDTNGNPV